MTDIPVVMTTSGAQPNSPSTLRAALVALVAASNPGYTANLPGSLIEDITSTDVGALIECDSARVELINSLTPFGANAFILNQLGQMLGIIPGATTNTAVFVIFTGTIGYIIPKGFTVSDGTHQYSVSDGGVIGSGGTSPALFCLATSSGSWPVPANSVVNVVTSVPLGITLTVNNPQPGTPGNTTGETEGSYRARVLQANLASSQGMTRYMKTLLGSVSGVTLVSVLNQNGGWEVVVAGTGDPYQIANAIFTALFDISSLVGSVIGVTAITKANPGVVTTNINHGLTNGQSNVFISGVNGMTAANGGPYTVTVIDQKNFSFAVNTTGFGTYTNGGTVTPNSRNQVVNLNDPPNTYAIPFVVSPQQSVTMSATYHTTSSNLVSNTAVISLAAPALASYINGLNIGDPINLMVMTTIFQNAVASILDPKLIASLTFSVNINGFVTAPTGGTQLVFGDPESYFNTSSAVITITQV